jgi:hypothetical protein
MKTKHILSIACFASVAAAGCKKDKTDPATPPSTPGATAPVPTGKAVAPSGALAAAIQAVNACTPDADCEGLDKLEDAARDLTPEQYRGAMQVAKSADAHHSLSRAVAAKLDEPLLLELVQATDGCPADQQCLAEEDLGNAADELSPALFRAGMKLAKNPLAKRDLIEAVSRKMDASLIPDISPYLADYDIGSAAQRALDSIEDTGALAQLGALLDRHDHTDTVHSEVPELLAKYPSNPSVKAAVPKLMEMARHDAQGWGKANAAIAVAKIQGAASVPFLVEYLTAETWGPARARVTEELGKLKSSQVAVAELKKLAKDADKDVSQAATKALQ